MAAGSCQYIFHPFLLGCYDGGMDDGIEFVKAATAKGYFSQFGAVEAAVWGDYLGAEGSDDLVVDFVAGFHHLAAE